MRNFSELNKEERQQLFDKLIKDFEKGDEQQEFPRGLKDKRVVLIGNSIDESFFFDGKTEFANEFVGPLLVYALAKEHIKFVQKFCESKNMKVFMDELIGDQYHESFFKAFFKSMIEHFLGKKLSKNFCVCPSHIGIEVKKLRAFNEEELRRVYHYLASAPTMLRDAHYELLVKISVGSPNSIVKREKWLSRYEHTKVATIARKLINAATKIRKLMDQYNFTFDEAYLWYNNREFRSLVYVLGFLYYRQQEVTGLYLPPEICNIIIFFLAKSPVQSGDINDIVVRDIANKRFQHWNQEVEQFAKESAAAKTCRNSILQQFRKLITTSTIERNSALNTSYFATSSIFHYVYNFITCDWYYTRFQSKLSGCNTRQKIRDLLREELEFLNKFWGFKDAKDFLKKQLSKKQPLFFQQPKIHEEKNRKNPSTSEEVTLPPKI